MTGLPLEPVADVEAAASRAAGRALHDEGIPMVLALEDVTGAAQPGQAGADAAAIGTELAQRLVDYHAVLFPGAGGDEYWPLHDALAVLAAVHGPGAGAAP